MAKNPKGTSSKIIPISKAFHKSILARVPDEIRKDVDKMLKDEIKKGKRKNRSK